MVSYNKTDSLTFSQQKVMRFMNPRHARILHGYLSYVKPIEALFLNVLTAQPQGGLAAAAAADEHLDDPDFHDEDDDDEDQPGPAAPAPAPANLAYPFLFTKRGKRMKAAAIVQTFYKVLQKEAGLPLLFSEYRDAAVALFRVRRRQLNGWNLDAIAARQAGHQRKRRTSYTDEQETKISEKALTWSTTISR